MKKIPTLLVRDPDDRRHVTDEVTPGCEWVLAGEGVATRKYDGTCVRITHAPDGELVAHTRREVKPGKTPPPGFIPVEYDDATGKTVGWEPAEQSSYAKPLTEALASVPERFTETVGTPVSAAALAPGTYELIGPKVNGNPEGAPRHSLVQHALADRVYLAGEPPYTVQDARAAVAALADRVGYEGIVWHHPDGRMAKLKARDLCDV